MTYLRNIEDVDEMDLIIALGMAKEGFDWAYCEHALTVGYRGSLTEMEATLMIRPQCCCCMWGRASWVVNTTDLNRRSKASW